MRLRKFFDSIAFRISVSIAVVVAATTMSVSWLLLREERKTLELELRSKGMSIARLMSHNITEPLLFEERQALFSLLKASMIDRKSLVVHAEVYDKNRSLVVTAYKDETWRNVKVPTYNFEEGQEDIGIQEDSFFPIYHISMPVKLETLGTIGFLRMSITKEYLYKTLENVRKKLYLLAVAVISVGIVVGLLFARQILRPILILNKGVKMVGKGEIGVEIPVVGVGEIRELALSFNRMSEKLREQIEVIKKAQDNLVRTEKLYAIGEFSAGVAHEIKNPLTAIKMLMQTLRNKKKALSDRDFEIIEGEINRIDNIVREFLAFARPEHIEKTEVNINDILQEVITITKPKMEQSTIQLEQIFYPDLPMIKGNNDGLKQVFLNIVLNAIQAMNGGGSLSMKTSVNKETLSVMIGDTGDGIPKQNLKRIFDPFFTTKEEGTGMGLALTYKIVSDHSGNINLESSIYGTTVTVELPL